MLTEWHEIRRLHQEDAIPKRELARRFGKDVKTIRRILEQEAPPTRAASRRAGRLTPFREKVRGWLRNEADLTARAVFARLQPEVGSISERSVRKFVASVREEIGREVSDSAASLGAAQGAPAPEAAPSEPAWAEPEAASPVDEPEVAAAPQEEEEPAPTTPADPGALPRPDANGEWDLSRHELFLNRELTWLNFNFRVLHEAEDPRTPVLERLKFVAIVSSNLDEFFMKRIGGLKQQVGAGLHDPSLDGRTPQQQIVECLALVRQIKARTQAALIDLLPLMRDHGVHLRAYDELGADDQVWLREHYIDNIFPLVTPQAMDPAHPFPFVSNLSLNLLVGLRYRKDAVASIARVKVPVGAGTPRLLKLPDSNTFVPMEGVLAGNLELLFPGMTIESCALFRVTRNANTEIAEDKADDLLAMIETELRERKFAPIVRLEVSEGIPPVHRGMLAADLGLDEQDDVFEVDGLIAMRDLMELVTRSEFQESKEPGLYDAPHHPADHPELTTDRNIFHTIRDAGSLLLHHPYESFPNSVERFLKEAANDPKVRAVKMTLYRTSATSRAIRYLIDAASNGKQVAVVVELKARFDEAANIRWANRMEQVGIHVTYGVVGLKTHCKAILVVRQDYNGLRRYVHVGTGNYHAGTARIYSDVGLLTSDPDIGRDLTELFNYLTTGYTPKRNYHKVLPAPKLTKKGLLARIEREIASHSDESPGLIQFKTNALEDATVTRALYRASQAGVHVDLFLRDTCRLRPGIPGLSENIRVISVVGRFLEHTRIYYFCNGGEEEYYIGSADCMKRNLDSRVELICPVDDAALRDELRQFLDIQANDRRSAWEMRPDGSYVQLRGGEKGTHEMMIEWAHRRQKRATRLRRRRTRTARVRRRG